MMSPQASFAYNYGYGISPARIIASTARGGVGGNSRQRYSTSAGSSSTSNSFVVPVPVTKHTLEESASKSTPMLHPNAAAVDTIEAAASTK